MRESTACSCGDRKEFFLRQRNNDPCGSSLSPLALILLFKYFGDVCTYGGGVLLLLVQFGAASLLAVAVLLQRVKHLIGQLQVHPQTIADMNLWSKLQQDEKRAARYSM